MKPTVTLGIPVFNGEDYLEEALEAAVSQTYRNLEIVVSDNASTDRTDEICRKFAVRDDRIVHLRAPENRGGLWNYMEVARRGRGQLFTWLAADDIKSPDFVSACLRTIETSDAVVAYCHTRSIDERGERIEEFNDNAIGSENDPADRLASILRAQASHLVYGLIRADALRRTRGLRPVVGDDMVLLAELACLGRFVRADDGWFAQRRRPDQFSALRGGQVKWIHPDAGVRFAFPQTMTNVELLRAVASAPLGARHRARLGTNALRYWALPRWRGMARDVVTALAP